MKKSTLGIYVFLALGTMQLDAQTTSFGVKGDANISNFLFSDAPGMTSELGFGASIGGFVKFDLGKSYAIQPEFIVHYQTSTTKIYGIENDYQYFGLEIPVYSLRQWYSNAGGRFYLGLGPYIGLGLNARFTSPEEINLYDTGIMDRFDAGAKLMYGYEFTNGIQININYKIGFINTIDDGNKKMYPEMISLSVGYRF